MLSFLPYLKYGMALLISASLLGCAYHPMTPRGVSDIGEVLPFGSQTTPKILVLQPHDDAPTLSRPQSLLSPGDALRLDIFDDKHFSGRYIVSQSGSISIPFLGKVEATGSTQDDLQTALVERFTRENYFRSDLLRLAVEVVEWAPAQISVAGAVHEPGQVVINAYPDTIRRREIELRSGAATVKRFVQHALVAAGGLRPDADLNNVFIRRGSELFRVPMHKHFSGHAVANVSLIAGDRLEVGSTGVFQEPLARPSAFTSPGFRVYLSNLTTPAANNASSSIGRDSTRLPTGSRLSHAITSANCFGGTPIFNAPRRVKYVTRNPLTSIVTSHIYNVEEVMLRANETIHNPYLQPEDQLGCYESPIGVVREAARTAYDLVSPAIGIEILRDAVTD